jgi:hypothetical protein
MQAAWVLFCVFSEKIKKMKRRKESDKKER